MKTLLKTSILSILLSNLMYFSTQRKQIVILYGATIIGILLGVISSVINTRNLSPYDYGDVRYIQNLISFISSLLLLGYFTSGSRLLALSKDEECSRKIRGAIVTIMLLTIIILSLIMLILYVYSLIQGENNLTPLYLISVFTSGNVILLNYINTTSQGDNHIGRIALARLLPTFFYIVAAIFIYKIYYATPLLMLILYNGIAVLILGILIYSSKPCFKDIKSSLKMLNEENKKYGLQVYIGSLAGVSTTYIAGITLGNFCSNNSNVGFYTLALTIAMPLSMLPSTIGTAYFKRFANETKISNKIIFWSVFMTFLTYLIFIIIVDFIVRALYTASYYSVSTYASFLAIATSLHGLGDMFNRFLGAHGQGKQIRNGAIVCGTIVVIGNIILVYYWQIIGAIITKIIGSMAYMLMMTYYYIKFTYKKENDKFHT